MTRRWYYAELADKDKIVNNPQNCDIVMAMSVEGAASAAASRLGMGSSSRRMFVYCRPVNSTDVYGAWVTISVDIRAVEPIGCLLEKETTIV